MTTDATALSTRLDEQARRIIRTVEPFLRRHLGTRGLSPELIGDLYLGVRGRLSSTAGGGRGGDPSQAADLALHMYLTVVADDTGERAGPELLNDLRHALAGAWKELENGQGVERTE